VFSGHSVLVLTPYRLFLVFAVLTTSTVSISTTRIPKLDVRSYNIKLACRHFLYRPAAIEFIDKEVNGKISIEYSYFQKACCYYLRGAVVNLHDAI